MMIVKLEGEDDRQRACPASNHDTRRSAGLYSTSQMEPTNTTVTTYTQQADALVQAISALPAELIVQRPAENRWSVLEIVSHLADAELLASVRLRRIITQDRANLWGYRQEHWASVLGYRQGRIETVAARFALLRRENADLLPADSTDEVWHFTGSHDEYGTLSLRQLVEDYLGHTAKHLDQIKKVAAEVAGGNIG